MDDATPIKDIIEQVLTEAGFADSRASKLSVDDLLKFVTFASLFFNPLILMSQALVYLP